MSVLPTTPMLPLGRANGVATIAAAVPRANPAIPMGRRKMISAKTLPKLGAGTKAYAGTVYWYCTGRGCPGFGAGDQAQ